ncbi:MAG TPA: T9SS type A sorting domain-containing protein [Chitinophagaceae bacterium]|jgi:hypothetical protein|nr:T9SS type A sorting domain-containing protein [Chitinophagaceae bacterium]
MKKLLSSGLFLFYLSICCVENVVAQPTVPSGGISFSSIDGTFMQLIWTAGNGSNRIVVARAGSPVSAVPANGTDYNESNIFGNGDAILPGQFVVSDDNGQSLILNGLQPATIYYFRIYEYDGSGATTQYLTSSFASANQSTVVAPTISATNLVFSNVTGNSMTLTWANGNGERRLVVAKANAAVNANPVDLNFYSASSAFSFGTEIGTGNFVMFNGDGNTVDIIGLQPGITYHFAIYEYNGFSSPVYRAASPAIGNQVTSLRPSVPSSNMVFNNIDGTSMQLSWTPGNGTRRIVIARQGSPVTAVPVDGTDYAENSDFQLAAAISPGQRVVFDDVNSFLTMTGLLPNTTYYFRIYEYDGTGASIGYLTTSFVTSSQITAVAPTISASNLLFSNITGSSMTLTWTSGNGERRIVVAREGSAVNANPVDLTAYSGSPAFGFGSEIGSGNFVVSNNSGNTVDISNLQPGVTYHFAIFEFNGFSNPVYRTVSPATGSSSTDIRPTVPSSNILFSGIDGAAISISWTPGDGIHRIVVARAGSPVDAVPVDGVDYAENNDFQLAADLTTGQRVVYDNTSSFFTMTGLLPNTVYHFRVYEYNGSGGSIAYLTTSFATGSQSTAIAPAISASNIIFSDITGVSMKLSWTSGDGERSLVVARAGSAVNSDPVDLTAYSGNPTFGFGSEIGSSNYVIQSNTGNSVDVSGLLPGVTYHFAVYPFNGFSTPVYRTVSPAIGSQVTDGAPSVPSSGLSFANIEGTSMLLNWTPGNGTRRIVVARAGAAVDAIPVNGIDYAEYDNFSLAAQISSGQRVVYDNPGSSFILSGLLPGTVYYFRVYEYNGTGAGITYLTTSPATGNQSTVSVPTLQSSNIGFSAVTANSATIGWTNGNGTSRLVVARANTAVNANPVDLTSYIANSSFGAGSEIGTGNFVVAKTSGTSTNVAGLVSGTTYHFAVYEYNGVFNPLYLRPGATGNVTTQGAPQTQATNVSAGSVTATTLQLTWTNGSGNSRLVLMKQGSAVNANPADNGAYTANTAFGAGTQLGTGNYVVYKAAGNSVTITGLIPNTVYHFAVFEYNAFGANSQFLVTNPARGNATTLQVLPVTLLEFNAEPYNNTIRLKWATAQETNSSHFDIEKSADGVSFTRIGTVSAAGNSSIRKDYSYTDKGPLSVINYYRLKQVDLDNRFVYSPIVRIKYEAGPVENIANPVQTTLSVRLNAAAITPGSEWLLYDMNGKIIRRKRITGPLINEPVETLAPGVYLLEIKMGEKRDITRLIKL